MLNNILETTKTQWFIVKSTYELCDTPKDMMDIKKG